MADESRIQDLITQAEKKIKGGFLGMGGGKHEEAAELYTKAANIYKMNSKGDKAADLFLRAANSYDKAGSRHDTVSCYVSAANCIRKTNPREASKYLDYGVGIYSEDGRFGMAAKLQKEIAEILEKEMEFEAAVEAYTKAAKMYEGENSQSTADACWLQVALFSAQLEKYENAIKIYDAVAVRCCDNKLTKFSFRDYAFRAVLCSLCNEDLVGARKMLERYTGMDPNFGPSREYRVLAEVCDAIENFDVEAFTNAVGEYDSISKLDQWKSSMLLRVKNSIKEEEVSLT